MDVSGPVVVSDSDAAVQAIINRVGNNIVLGLPLGLGKPLRFANALYRRACQEPALTLHVVTGLSLQVPRGESAMERRFLEPFVQRLYGAIPELEFARDAAAGKLPANVTVSEFFFQAGSFLDQPQQQQHFVCSNYTHVPRDLIARGLNVIAQMVAPDPDTGESDIGQTFSLSGNPDLTLDLIPMLRQRQAEGMAVALLAETNSALPFMGNDAAVAAQTFDVVLHNPSGDYPLFSVPHTAVSTQDHLIGFYASTLIRDGGTLQVGIGSLATALVHNIILRHQSNTCWRRIYDQLEVAGRFPVATEWGGTEPFTRGLYGCSEMMMEGFIHLIDAGVITRKVYDDVQLQEALNSDEILPLDDDALREGGTVMHGGFFLGSRAFYDRLRCLTQVQRASICMTSVNFTNDLFDHRFGNQRLKVAQRVHSRFFNSAMLHTLSGAAVSDGLDDARVVSGVGGQYNFIAMAHDLPGARSIVTLRSTREKNGVTHSNIVFDYSHCTIPRHLRDIVITEYGIADLRGQTDEEVYRRLIAIADARFQADLVTQAKNAGKLAADFILPSHWKNNTAQAVNNFLTDAKNALLFPAFPFGHDFTDDELVLAAALKKLATLTATPSGKVLTLVRAILTTGGADDQQLLARMSLTSPGNLKSWLEKRLLIFALRQSSSAQ